MSDRARRATPPEPPGYPATIPSPPGLERLHEVMVRCTRCDLFLGRTRVVPGEGPARAALLFVGEAPGATEDREGRPFVGRAGALLDTMLKEATLRREDVFVANVIRCRPPANRNPRAAELRACSGWMREQIRLVDPRIVVTLGRFALQHFLPGARITTIQGQIQRASYHGAELRIYPLVHPSAVLRNPALREDYAIRFRELRAQLDSL